MKINKAAAIREIQTFCLVLFFGLLVVFILEWEGVLIWLGFEEFVLDIYYKYAP